MLEKIFKKQEETQEKVQAEQKVNEEETATDQLTDEEMEKVVGGGMRQLVVPYSK